MATETTTTQRPGRPFADHESLGVGVALALAGTGAAVGVRLALEPLLGDDRGVYMIATAAVLAAAALGGTRAGILCTLVTALIVDFVWIPPRHALYASRASDLFVLTIFIVVGLTISALAGRLRRAKRRAVELAANEVRARLAAQRSEERFRRIFEQSPLGIALADLDRHVEDANPMFCRMLGYSLDELRGRSVDSLTYPPDVDESVTRVRRLYAGGTPSYSYVKRYVRKEGQFFWAMVSVTAVRDADGRATHSLAMVQDITERKRLEQALERAKEEAESANRAKDQFLAVLSHELRTPLSPVLLTASTMEEDPALPAAARENLQMIRQNVELEARLIDDLLDLTGIARGKLTLHPMRVDAHALIGQALYTVEQDLRDKGVAVETHLNAPNALLDGDPARLQQVFWNLLKNAVKFTPRGGTITVRTCDVRHVQPAVPCEHTTPESPAGPDGPPAAKYLVVQVRDSGIGIPADTLRRLFRPFEQGSAGVTHRFGGLGLGLAISRSIVELHGGHIDAASEGPGRGATFTVYLPLAPSPAPSDEAPPSLPPPPTAASPAPRPLRVLLVEDHPATRRAMAAILQSLGHTVRHAGTLADALALADADPCDVVVSDLALPDGSGHDLMRRLKRGDRPPCGIAVSGYGMPDDIRRSRDAGFDAHLTKPVSREKIREALCNVVPIPASPPAAVPPVTQQQ